MKTMTTFKQALRREARVAFSLRAQPLWIRILKWIVALTLAALYHDEPWFWPVVAGWTVFALVLHSLYHWKTRSWTRPWGGWNDLDAGRSK
ncbi:MAG: hypothetical protein HZA89_09260 [Verrucomicrobia bacterium]|nr:hypothetical protein [Verrucomicrobiota bacterium]